jgi:hypothetical protein
MRTLIATLAALALAGCAAQVTSATPRGVIIDAGARLRPGLAGISSAEAQRMADAECGKHGRFASMKARPDPTSNEYVFDCVQ